MSEEERPTVRVAQGLVRGRRVACRAGGSYLSFQGLPYAEPPVGPLRFKPAQPPRPWLGVRDALQEGPDCPQADWLLQRGYRGHEDCLYLNVYTPQLPEENEKAKMAVMVLIHGGAFEVGSGSTDCYGPDYLVQEGIVLVTINYRLGVFGFLGLDDPCLPGNLGLKDQVAALRWVQANINRFGGDSENVTIFGESAGGACVHLHMYSPLSKGLFHGAIAQSGCALNFWTLSPSIRMQTFKLGEVLGFKASSPAELVSFLRTVSAEKLVEASHKLGAEENVTAQLHFAPVAEVATSPEEETFLPANARELMTEGKFHPVPLILGITSQEGVILLTFTGVYGNMALLNKIGSDFKKQLPPDIADKENVEEISEAVKKFYFGSNKMTEESFPEFINFLSDVWFNREIEKAVDVHARNASSPVYYYHFAFDGDLNIYKNIIKASHIRGASHFDDIGYLFRTLFCDTEAKNGSRSWKTLRRMVKMWTNFAKTRNPTPAEESEVGVHWTPYTAENPVYLDIDEELVMKKDLYKERMNFWKSL